MKFTPSTTSKSSIRCLWSSIVLAVKREGSYNQFVLPLPHYLAAVAFLSSTFNVLGFDTDHDGLEDFAETGTGIYVSPENTGTSPRNPDSDEDGAGDWYEVYASFTDPNDSSKKPRIPYPLPNPDQSPGETTKPVKVYIMSGSYGMNGWGFVGGTLQGSLEQIVRSEHKFTYLQTSVSEPDWGWETRQDVRIHAYESNGNNAEKSLLSPTWYDARPGYFGPELGFGSVLGWFHDEPVLLIRASTGNRALGWDLLPPSSPRFDAGTGLTYPGHGESPEYWATGSNPIPIGWYAGKDYNDYFLDENDMFVSRSWQDSYLYNSNFPVLHNGVLYVSKSAHFSDSDSEPGFGLSWTNFWSVYSVDNVVDILDNFSTEYPDWSGQGFEIAGYVWWQGYRDAAGKVETQAAHTIKYEENLVRLIKSLRQYFADRYPGRSSLSTPFVVATIGFLGDAQSGNFLQIANAQMAVDGDSANYPEFKNNVMSVDTRPYWRDSGISPGNYLRRYNYNAETYMLVGDAMGRSMIGLHEASALASRYSAWVGSIFQNRLTNTDPEHDFDHGGLATGLEWVLGGDPTNGGDDGSLGPEVLDTDSEDNKVEIVFRRFVEAKDDASTEIQLEYCSDLVGWTAAVHQGPGKDQITITEEPNGFARGIDKVTVSLPASISDGDQLFARLKVVVTP
ncbi:hypothetical protein [Haloferula sp. A504]|uniref:hypothetical protein n=1 Tax=Haloferula sp. A504 TaxID=3373601 RepID=UPI0031C5359B|nr:hypothetical protein [Verrucomicrobiaceae bacterium E54]